jgi:hypothetical protein
MPQPAQNEILSPSVKANFDQKKIYQYVVTLKNTQSQFVQVFSISLLSISSFIFLVEQWLSPGISRILLVCPLFILTMLAYNIYKKKKDQVLLSYKTALFMAAIGWTGMPYLSWLFLPFVALAMLEKGAGSPLEIGFADNKIVINTVIRRSYTWADFTNVVLKDNLLTMDFKNNRLFQRETIAEEGDTEEDEFNEYCQEQLNKYTPL